MQAGYHQQEQIQGYLCVYRNMLMWNQRFLGVLEENIDRTDYVKWFESSHALFILSNRSNNPQQRDDMGTFGDLALRKQKNKLEMDIAGPEVSAALNV